jgi:hypothetical protein
VALDYCYPLYAKGPGPGFQILCRFCESRTHQWHTRRHAAADWRNGLVTTPFEQAQLDRLNDEIGQQMAAEERAEQDRARARGNYVVPANDDLPF